MGNWFGNWRSVVGTPRPRRRCSHRPVLEALEQRCLLDAGAGFVQTALVSDVPGLARHTDANLINPWGIAPESSGGFRVAINGAGQAVAINASGAVTGQPVTLPPPLGSPPGTTSAPTGDVLNTTSDFVISDDGRSAPATFLFATEDGTIIGWNPKVDRTEGVLVADQSAVGPGAVYKGLAEGSTSSGNFLYATNFRNGTVDVFDTNFDLVNQFTDPSAPTGFAPFGIQNIGGTLFVTYAVQDAAKHDDVEGPGNGFIDEFDTSGHLIMRFATGTTAGGTLKQLNSPWGMAVAPDGFGDFGGDLLVGNFGDSHVNVFDLKTGAFVDQLRDTSGNPLVLNGGFQGSDTKGLWGIFFGSGHGGSRADTLFFAAGINDESDGLFGTVTVAGKAHGGGAPHAKPASAVTMPPGKASGPNHVLTVQPPSTSGLFEGHVATTGGSSGMAGHSVLSTDAIAGGSAGLVTHFVPKKAQDALFSAFDSGLLG
jgi:uncharacterized protein (TIGR03118 family)